MANNPDGPEERTAFYQESFERSADEIDRLEQLADEQLDEVLLDQARDRLDSISSTVLA